MSLPGGMQGTLFIIMASLKKAQLMAVWQVYSCDIGQVTKEALDTTKTPAVYDHVHPHGLAKGHNTKS